MLITDKSRPRPEIAEFFRENSWALQWALTLLLLNGLVGSLFDNQGYWRISGLTCLLPSVGGLLYLFVWFRLAKPSGVQDIGALMLLTLIPTAEISFANVYLQALLYVTLFCRWHMYSRIVALFVLPSLVPLVFLMSTSSYCKAHSPEGGELIGKANGIYYLYRYIYPSPKSPRYALFRQVKIFPHVELVKQIDQKESEEQVCISRKKDGSYVIAECTPKLQGQAFPEELQAPPKKVR